MIWLVSFIALVAIAGIFVNVSRWRLEQRTAREVHALIAVPCSEAPWQAAAALPEPVARYRDLAVGDRAPVRTLKLRHSGTFRPSPTAKPTPIRGTQVFTADPPGFVSSARIVLAPGVWLDARDMAVAGSGSMRVLLNATVPVVDAQGPKLDQGSALRLLAEMVWYPTALFDARYVTWSPIDGAHARAALRFGASEVSGIFEFGVDGLPVSMSAERFTDQGELRPWGGTYHDWRTVSGMRVPFEASVTWQLQSGPCTYAHWLVETMTYDDTNGLMVTEPVAERPSLRRHSAPEG